MVRWPDLSVSIIQADDEDHLQQLLDHVADPRLAVWVEYDGPLWFEFAPNVGLKRNGDVKLRAKFSEEPAPSTVWRRGGADGDVEYEMFESMLEQLFPHLNAAVADVCRRDLSGRALEKVIRRAVEKEQWHRRALDEHCTEHPVLLPPPLAHTVLCTLDRIEAEGSERDIEAERSDVAVMLDISEEWHEELLERLEAERERAAQRAANGR